MGCANSKQKKRCRHCQSPYAPVPRSYSMHVHHPPQWKGDSYHVVALQSTTLGSLKLDFKSQNQSNNNHVDDSNSSSNGVSVADDDQDHNHHCNGGGDKEDKGKEEEEEFNMGLLEAKVRSNMIEEKIPKMVPKTPIRTPPGEPETIINTWELMEGLEDGISPHRSPNHFRSFSFGVVRNPVNATAVCLQKEDQESSIDPPGHPFNLRPLTMAGINDMPLDSIDGKKEKVVVYLTSLRGVRKTYEDCCYVRVMLKGLGVGIDERDVSMHSGFKEELKELLGDRWFNKGGLPKVFVGNNYIGGAEEIRRMHEEGKLQKMVENWEMVDDGGACEACGDMRFVPCETCSGSCKIYYEEEEEEGEESEYGFRRCPDCNENGLIRCPICCY